jgi:hypothetical protein
MGPGRAGRVLHGQRFTLPLRLTTAAQPLLGCRPPPAAMLTNNHHPPPALDDVAERPEVPGRPGRVQRLVQALLEPGPVGVRQGGTDLLGPLGAGPDRSPARHRSRNGSSRPNQPSAQACDRACSASLHAVLAAARQGHHRATGLTEADGCFPDDDSAGIRPNTIQYWMTGTTLPRPPDAAPKVHCCPPNDSGRA